MPAVLLVCRNSTDTAYFQRLRPYPRVLLRRSFTLFKARPRTLDRDQETHICNPAERWQDATAASSTRYTNV